MTKRFLVCVLAASCIIGSSPAKSKKPAPPAEAERIGTATSAPSPRDDLAEVAGPRPLRR